MDDEHECERCGELAELDDDLVCMPCRAEDYDRRESLSDYRYMCR